MARLVECKDDVDAQLRLHGQLAVAQFAEVCLLVYLNVVREPCIRLNDLLFDKFLASMIKRALNLELRWRVVPH